MNDLLGLDPQPWENLERIIFRGWIWYDHVYGGKRLSFSNLSFKVLVVEVPCGSPNARVEEVVGLFLDPVSKKDGRFLEEIERIEFRLVGEFTSDIEHKFRVEVKKRVARGLSSLERRLLPLFVSVSEDGQERAFGGLE